MHRNRRRDAADRLGARSCCSALAAPAVAAPAHCRTGRPDAGPRSPPPRPGAGRPATVTLITGDRVTVTAGGRLTVRPGAGREGMQLPGPPGSAATSPCVPQDALPLIRSGRVDRRLFDVTGLIAAGYDDAHRDTLPLLRVVPAGGIGPAGRGRSPAPG